MGTTKFLTPTLEEYRALVRLKKSGVEKVIVSFSGAGDDGSYDSIDFYDEHPVDKKAIAEDLKIIEKYLHKNLDARHDFSFDNEGCRGSIEIDLTEEQFEMTLSTEVPVWTDDLFVRDHLAPSSEIERLASEVTA